MELAAPTLTDGEFALLLRQAYQGHTQAVLAAVDKDGRLATRASADWYRRTLLHWACIGGGGHVELARGLLARGASVGARDGLGRDATYHASCSGNVALVTLLLDHGGNPCTRADNDDMTALGIAASKGHLAVCLLLLSKGADLTAVMDGRTALGLYGEHAYPPLSPEVLAEHRAALEAAWRAGPHPSAPWARRLPVMLFVTGCRFRPLAGRQGWVPPEGLSLEQRERARRRSLVFSSDVLLRLIVSFL